MLQSAAILIKFLYNMVLDTFDRYKYSHIVAYFYKKNYIVKINLMYQIFKVLNSY